MRVAYRADPANGMTVSVIKCWVRGEIPGLVMGSGGPKDYISNGIWAIFDGIPSASRVLMVRGEFKQSTPFLLVGTAAGQFFDMAAKEVLVEP